MARQKAVMSWSSGKDSAFALYKVLEAGDLEVVGLLTSLNHSTERVSIHGVREDLLDAQAEALGLPLVKVPLPDPCSNADYEAVMGAATRKLVADGVEVLIFGDLFLEDIRAYREDKLKGSGLRPIFPLWGKDTSALAREMLASGLEATLSCIDCRVVPEALSGRPWDEALLEVLPPTVDPCGENGEFHSFAHAGPMFKEPIRIQTGVEHRDGDFLFRDLLPRG